MPIVKIEPTDEHPVPYDLSDETTKTALDEVTVDANTAELQVSLGRPLDEDVDDTLATAQEKELLDAVIQNKKTHKPPTVNTAFAAAAFLRTYGQQLALDAASARAAITNKLLELANCGDPRFELKALELLGKHSDIGIFTERSEVTINYKDPAALEEEIKERVKRLLNADVIDVTPVGANLDEELGVLDADLEDFVDDIPEEDITLTQVEGDDDSDELPDPSL